MLTQAAVSIQPGVRRRALTSTPLHADGLLAHRLRAQARRRSRGPRVYTRHRVRLWRKVCASNLDA